MQVSIINALKSSSRIEAVFSFVETTAAPDHLPLCSYPTITCRSMVAVCAWPAVQSHLLLPGTARQVLLLLQYCTQKQVRLWKVKKII